MKLFLPVDAAYAFDYWSIFYIKFKMGKLPLDELNQVSSVISLQIGTELFNKIIDSNECGDLIKANQETFDLVDKAKNDSIRASEVDRANYQRFIAKQALQKKFFKDGLAEVKIGYEKYV